MMNHRENLYLRLRSRSGLTSSYGVGSDCTELPSLCRRGKLLLRSFSQTSRKRCKEIPRSVEKQKKVQLPLRRDGGLIQVAQNLVKFKSVKITFRFTF
jgi:hypothetical protein